MGNKQRMIYCKFKQKIKNCRTINDCIEMKNFITSTCKPFLLVRYLQLLDNPNLKLLGLVNDSGKIKDYVLLDMKTNKIYDLDQEYTTLGMYISNHNYKKAIIIPLSIYKF